MTNVTAFLGIPFASKPERFRAAVGARWTETLNASRAGAACPQAGKGDEIVGSEDCLVLNAWSSMVPGRAVLFYVHGGGFQQGRATTAAENLTRATGQVVCAPGVAHARVLRWSFFTSE